MRLIHTADWHLGKSLEGVSRLYEQELFLQDFVELVEEKNPDLVLIAGDIFDSYNPPAKAEQLFYRTLKNLSKNGERLVVVIAGNHDNPERLVAAGPLAMEHGIVMAGLPKTVVPPGIYGKQEIIESGEGYIKALVNGEKMVLLLCPYPSERRLKEVLYGDMEEEEERLISYTEALDHWFRQLETHFEEDAVNLMAAHLFVEKSVEAGSERSIALGGSYLLPGALLPEKAQYIALGHVHKTQIVPETSHRAYYSGAPLVYHKGELNARTGDMPPKNCMMVEVEAGKEAKVETVPIPVYKPIELWRCESIEEAIRSCEAHQGEDSYVYLEVQTDSYIKEDQMKEMRRWKEDILAVTPVPVQRETPEEGETVRMEDKSILELFCDYYRSVRNMDLDQETLDVLKEILVEEEVTEDETD